MADIAIEERLRRLERAGAADDNVLRAPAPPAPGSFGHTKMERDAIARQARVRAAAEAEERSRVERERAAKAEEERRVRNAPAIARLRAERKILRDSRAPHDAKAAEFDRLIRAVDEQIEALS